MIQKSIFQTFFARFLILFLNFGLIIFSTNIWGSEGKGVISIVVADLAIIGFVSNIFVGSSMTFFAAKYKTEQILFYAYIWSFLVGIILPVILYFSVHGFEHLYFLMALSVMFSLFSANINLFVGKQNIKKFNLYTILQQAVHLVFILALVYLFKFKSVNSYFLAQISCYVLLFFISFFQLIKGCSFKNIIFSKKIQREMFSYGWKSQLSAFVQFLNYRLSFYFLEFFRGIASVGIFSIGVAVSEAIWTISRSLSIILYAKIVNEDDHKKSLEITKTSIKLSFLITLLFILVVLIIPSQIYTAVFGKDFHQTKKIFLLLSPGILAIAVSNIIGYYFAGMNKLRILNVKSFIGLGFTAGASFFVIPRWGIEGACIVTTISYCLSSAVLFWKFYQITDFNTSDFLLSKTEFDLLLLNFRKKI